MTGIDSAPVARLEAPPESLAVLAPDVLRALTSEFFVEWQVADNPTFVPAVRALREVNSL